MADLKNNDGSSRFIETDLNEIDDWTDAKNFRDLSSLDCSQGLGSGRSENRFLNSQVLQKSSAEQVLPGRNVSQMPDNGLHNLDSLFTDEADLAQKILEMKKKRENRIRNMEESFIAYREERLKKRIDNLTTDSRLISQEEMAILDHQMMMRERQQHRQRTIERKFCELDFERKLKEDQLEAEFQENQKRLMDEKERKIIEIQMEHGQNQLRLNQEQGLIWQEINKEYLKFKEEVESIQQKKKNLRANFEEINKKEAEEEINKMRQILASKGARDEEVFRQLEKMTKEMDFLEYMRRDAQKQCSEIEQVWSQRMAELTIKYESDLNRKDEKLKVLNQQYEEIKKELEKMQLNASQEQHKILTEENSSLKEQIAKITNENESLKQATQLQASGEGGKIEGGTKNDEIVKALKDEIESLKQSLQKETEKKDSTKSPSEMSKLQAEIASLKTELEQQKTKLGEKDTAIAKLTADLQAANKPKS